MNRIFTLTSHKKRNDKRLWRYDKGSAFTEFPSEMFRHGKGCLCRVPYFLCCYV